MKKYYIPFFVVLLFACNKVQYDVVRKEAHSKVSPPGTVWLKDSTYIDQCEIRNVDYMEYLYWLEEKDLPDYAAALPDTNVWISGKYYNAPYATYYLRHPAYRDYPVVGVSYEQAEAFCKWRSDRVMEFVSMKKGNKSFFEVEYRLPTKEEWEYAAAAGDMGNNKGDYQWSMSPFGYERLTDKDHKPKMWVKESIIWDQDSPDLFIPEDSHAPNKFGVCNMIGNVAEMIDQKGVSKGGSVLNSLYDCETGDSLLYTKPELWLGFRCVCIVKK